MKAGIGKNGSHSVRVVMVLKDPPAPYSLEDWYLKPVTGVPFVLLNILNLQRGGVNQLTVYHPQLKSETGGGRFEALSQDRRLTLDLNWVSDPEELQTILEQNESLWVFNGAALHRKREVQSLLTGTDNERLVRRIRGNDVPNLAQGETRFTEDEGAGESGELAYIPGAPGRQIERKRDFRRQTETLLTETGLSNDSLMDHLVTRKLSRQLTRFFVMTPLSPNQITLIAMLIGFVAAACFWSGGYEAGVAGAILLLVSAWVDCADGEVARLKFQESPLGGILDIWADNIVHAAVFFSMGMGLYFSTENGIYKIAGTCAVIGALGSFALLQSSLIDSKMRASEGEPEKADNKLVDQMANRDFVYFLFVMALIGRLDIFLGLTAVGSIAFALWLVLLRYRGAWSSSAGLCSKNSENT